MLRRAGWRLARAAEAPVKELCLRRLAARAPARQSSGPHEPRMAIVCEELFDAELGGHGGFGFTARALARHYGERAAVVFARSLGRTRRPELRDAGGVRVLHLPDLPRLVPRARRAGALLAALRPDFFLTIDYLTKYEYALATGPEIPLLLYLRDPRGPAEWQRIAGVPEAIAASGRPGAQGLLDIGRQRRASFQRALRHGRRNGRPFALATNGRFLVERGRAALGLPEQVVHDLPNPVALPDPAPPPPPRERPLLLLLGRLDPIKRPWIFFELARRLPALDFVAAGPVTAPAVMEPILARYASLPNLRLVGVALDDAKQALLSRCSLLVNTSIHEGLPVSFLEAFAHSRCVLSCVDPEGLVSRFGHFVGDLPGDGRDPACIRAFADGVEQCLADPEALATRGAVARGYVRREHGFEAFDRRLRAILASENWMDPQATSRLE